MKHFALKAPLAPENDTQNACLKLLEHDRRVAYARRTNNVVAQLQGAGGKVRPVWTALDSRGNPQCVVDLEGYLTNGVALLVEVKKSESEWRKTEWFEAAYAMREGLLFDADALKKFDKSERGRLLRQWVTLERLRKAGGFAVCVWSGDMLKNLLDAYWERTA